MSSLNLDHLTVFSQSQRDFVRPLKSELIRSGYVGQADRQLVSQSVSKQIFPVMLMNVHFSFIRNFTCSLCPCTTKFPNSERAEKNDLNPPLFRFLQVQQESTSPMATAAVTTPLYRVGSLSKP